MREATDTRPDRARDARAGQPPARRRNCRRLAGGCGENEGIRAAPLPSDNYYLQQLAACPHSRWQMFRVVSPWAVCPYKMDCW
jgi:hypothetical protein